MKTTRATRDQAGLEQFLIYRLHVLNKLSERGSAERFRALDVTLPEARLIASVGSLGPFSVMELARRANLDKSQASRAAEALVQRGLMRRASSDEDARVVLVSLTPQGRALYRKVIPIVRARDDDLFGCLGESERAALSRALDTVIGHAQAQPAK